MNSAVAFCKILKLERRIKQWKILIDKRLYYSQECKYFVTTPIFYVNSSPHIGHLYSAVLADVAQRYQNLKTGGETFLSSGVDEHGNKVKNASGNKDTQIYCDNIAKEYEDMLKLYNVNCSDFIRTTSSRHKYAVHSFWRKLEENKFIYKGEYSGWYCEADEAFIPENKVTTSPTDNVKRTIESGRPVEWISENNYKFKLSALQNDLNYWLSKNETFVIPNHYRKTLLTWINEDLNDVSISRPSSRVTWGIPVPNDSSQTIYVWLDALVNYLTAMGYPDKNLLRWPPDLQILGKDILRFHGLLWPALLIAHGLEPPKKLLCHSHWMVDGEKMSKTKQNVISPFSDLCTKLTSSGFRYFLLREGVPHSDGNFNIEKARRIINAELADKLGNLLNRCTGKSLNPKQIWPIYTEDLIDDYTQDLRLEVENMIDLCENHYENYNYYKAVDTIISVLQTVNKFFETMKPWELERNGLKMNTILSITMDSLRICAIILQPIIPEISNKILDKLNIKSRDWDSLRPFIWQLSSQDEHPLLSDKITVFPRLYFNQEDKKISSTV